ncbi:MAG: hypothetical protein KFF73_09295 [Cyclobacteriaceae bacterium]|nr:hypothetical protein [Cyclobacteriaceae bacterium]
MDNHQGFFQVERINGLGTAIRITRCRQVKMNRLYIIGGRPSVVASSSNFRFLAELNRFLKPLHGHPRI